MVCVRSARRMASSSKTLMDVLQPAKRLKISDSSSTTQTTLLLPKLSTVQFLSKSSDVDQFENRRPINSPHSPPFPPSSGLTADQKLRVGIKKSLAKSKMNLRICSERVYKSKGVDFVGLEKLLVEETWVEALPGELHKPYAKNLCDFVGQEVCCGNGSIYPPLHLIFNAFNSTPFDEVKVVILGQDPYHGPGQAMGLAFSVPEGVNIPSSLVNIFKELKQDLDCSIPSHGNLMKWTIQGVLLLNTVLTVRNHLANSHAKKGWEQFTDAVIRTISEKKKGVVFLLWGNSAQAKARLINDKKHHILKAAHPSGLSANRGFFGCRHFSRTNQILEKMGSAPIDWQL